VRDVPLLNPAATLLVKPLHAVSGCNLKVYPRQTVAPQPCIQTRAFIYVECLLPSRSGPGHEPRQL
jgi:hypothetical protein